MKKYSASAGMHTATSVTVRSEVISLTGLTPTDDLPHDYTFPVML